MSRDSYPHGDQPGYRESLTPVNQDTVIELLGVVDNKVGHLDPAPNGSRSDEFLSRVFHRTAWLRLSQTPAETNSDNKIAQINFAHTNFLDTSRDSNVHYEFFSTESGVELVETSLDNIPFEHIDFAVDPESYFDRVIEATQQGKTADREAGFGTVTQERVEDLLSLVRRAKSMSQPTRMNQFLEEFAAHVRWLDLLIDETARRMLD